MSRDPWHGPTTPDDVRCDVTASGAARATADEVTTLRRSLALPGREPFPSPFLKHADEQTVVGLAAVIDALRRAGRGADEFRAWGVVVASRLMGRTALAPALARFRAEGTWGVSPHIIPHHSLHAPSGTISLALKSHGPNFGAGGGPGAFADGLLTAAALLEEGHVPGVWAVFTGWSPEPALDDAGRVTTPDAVCRAAALALARTPGRECENRGPTVADLLRRIEEAVP